jgi:hypothetical protein
MNYAILRFRKLKPWSQVKSASSHQLREKPKQQESKKSQILQDITTSEELIKLAQEKTTNFKIRKNAVLAVEFLTSASPNFFKQLDHKMHLDYFNSALAFLKDFLGQANYLGAVINFDRTSPYMCSYFLPIAGGKLNASYFFDGREKLQKLQTDFAKKVGEQFNLKRGTEGTGRRHKTVHSYWSNKKMKGEESIPN